MITDLSDQEVLDWYALVRGEISNLLFHLEIPKVKEKDYTDALFFLAKYKKFNTYTDFKGEEWVGRYPPNDIVYQILYDARLYRDNKPLKDREEVRDLFDNKIAPKVGISSLDKTIIISKISNENFYLFYLVLDSESPVISEITDLFSEDSILCKQEGNLVFLKLKTEGSLDSEYPQFISDYLSSEIPSIVSIEYVD